MYTVTSENNRSKNNAYKFFLSLPNLHSIIATSLSVYAVSVPLYPYHDSLCSVCKMHPAFSFQIAMVRANVYIYRKIACRSLLLPYSFPRHVHFVFADHRNDTHRKEGKTRPSYFSKRWGRFYAVELGKPYFSNSMTDTWLVRSNPETGLPCQISCCPSVYTGTIE